MSMIKSSDFPLLTYFKFIVRHYFYSPKRLEGYKYSKLQITFWCFIQESTFVTVIIFNINVPEFEGL